MKPEISLPAFSFADFRNNLWLFLILECFSGTGLPSSSRTQFSIPDLLQLYRQTLYMAVKEAEMSAAGNPFGEEGLAKIRTDLDNWNNVEFDPPGCLRLSKKSGACQKIVSYWKKLLGSILTDRVSPWYLCLWCFCILTARRCPFRYRVIRKSCFYSWSWMEFTTILWSRHSVLDNGPSDFLNVFGFWRWRKSSRKTLLGADESSLVTFCPSTHVIRNFGRCSHS